MLDRQGQEPRTHWMSWVVGLVDIGKGEIDRAELEGWGKMGWEEAVRSRASMGAGQQKDWGCAFLSLQYLLPSRLPGLSLRGSPPLIFRRRLQQNPVVSSASGRGSSPPPHLSARLATAPMRYALHRCSDLDL